MPYTSGFLFNEKRLKCGFATASTGEMQPVAPSEVLNRTLEGINESVGRSVTFKEDGVLEITTESGTFVGAWEYDASRALRPLTISWDENGEPQGYIAALIRQGDTYTLFGDWYVTDAFIQFRWECRLSGAM